MKQRSITAQASDGFRLQVRVALEEIGHRLIQQVPIFGYPKDGLLALVHFLYKKIIGNRRSVSYTHLDVYKRQQLKSRSRTSRSGQGHLPQSRKLIMKTIPRLSLIHI